ncbi:MAG: GNAT family N-acetyltransferase [Opitutaceae bacterium]
METIQREHALRPGISTDRERVWQIKRRCLRGYVEQTWGDWDDDIQRGQFDTDFDPGEIHLISVRGDDVGYISARNEPQEILLLNLMVLPEFQNRGIGTAVLNQLQTVARTLYVPIRLRVMKVNPARQLYERMGFTVYAETATHFRMVWKPSV